MTQIRRALISVSDKAGIVELASGLVDLGVEIISTGGTAKLLSDNGVPVRPVSDVTGFPEMMDGRVKTLHPKIHGGLLALRDNPEHMADAEGQGIEMIDLVVVNLYPFERTIANPEVALEDAIENIDIGGPTMLRSAAKNYRGVGVICDPARYDEILKELRENGGALSEKTKASLALDVFRHTAKYDVIISNWLGRRFAKGEEEPLPEVYMDVLAKVQGLRYGENPHQRAGLYRAANAWDPGLPGAKQLHGKELSFNNFLDLTAALEIARDFEEPMCAIIKHTNPCGAALAETPAQALEEAWAADPISAFGSVIGLNRVVDVETARRLGSNRFLERTIAPRYRSESGDEESTIIGAFVEAVIAPGYEPEALEILRRRKTLRIMELPDFARATRSREFDVRRIPGGFLIQDGDQQSVPASEYRIVTKKQPTPEQRASMAFADRIAKHVRSNAIILVQGTRLVGVGAGQMSRVDSSMIAARKAGNRANGSVLASDAMFPARDGLDAAAATGATAVIQPGGSVRDDEVIAAADEHGLVMAFTGMRHFKH